MKPSESAPQPSAPAPVSAPKTSAAPGLPSTGMEHGVAVCSICEKRVEAGRFRHFGPMAICDGCVSAMAPSPAAMTLAEPETEPEAELESVTQPAEEDEPVVVGVAGDKTCTGCARPLIEPGGYSMAGDEPYCPICYASLPPEPEQAAVGPRGPDESVSSDDGVGWVACDGCLRELPRSGVQMVEGYIVCHACTTTDIGAALTIARSRHRHRLKALLEAIEGFDSLDG